MEVNFAWSPLLISMMINPVSRAETPTRLRAKWILVPRIFWDCEWVGWRTRMDWVMRKRPVELRSCN